MRRCALVAAAIVVMAGLAGCGASDRPATLPYTRLTGIPGGEAIELRPAHPDGRTVLFVHGSGETAVGLASDPFLAPTLRGLLDAGYTIVAADAYGRAWGNPASMAAYLQLADRVDPDDHGIDVIARSMGGMVAFRLPDRHRVLAIAALFPACDLRSMDGGPYGEPIAAAYPTGLERALATESPAIGGHLAGVGVHVWASPDDTVVPAETNGYACAADARAQGAEVTLTRTTGEHGDASNYDADAVLDLFGR